MFESALLNYDRLKVNEILKNYLDKKNGLDFIDDYIVKSLTSIGDKWENGEVALSQVYMSSRLCEEIADSILVEKRMKIKNNTPIAIVTLENYHTLGKKIVCAVVRSGGYELKDYGSIIDSMEIINRVIDDGIKILLISVLMYTSALKIKEITQLLHEKNSSVKILVGGAPFLLDSKLWKDVGADQMGKSAADSLAIINQWMEENT